MALASAAALVAGTTAAAAYLDAKLHLITDISIIRVLQKTEREFARNAKANRQSCFYFFDEAVSMYPDYTAIWSRVGSYTFKQTEEIAYQYAAYFLAQGIRPGDLVAFYLQNSPEFIFAWLGLWAIGCAPAMINLNLAGAPLEHCLKVSGAKLLLVDEDEKSQTRIDDARNQIENELGIRPVVLSMAMQAEIREYAADRPDDSLRAGVTADFPAALFYTSGTTGLPKAAPFTTKRLFLIAAQRGYLCNQRSGPGGDKWYICMPYYHGTGGHGAMVCILDGKTLAIGKGFSVRNFWKDIRDSESTFFSYVGETARYLLAAPPHPLDKEHKVRCMYGNGLRPDVWLRFRERFAVPEVAEFFNSSEGVLSLFVWDCGPYLANCVGHHGALIRFVLRNTYVPVAIDPDTNEMIRDPKTGFAKRSSYEEGGEILVQIPNEAEFAGYYNNPEATDKKFARDVFKKGDLYYRSGDALRRLSDGRWFFIDRLGDTYRWKSENVSTAEVAGVVGNFPGIQEAIVYGAEVPTHEGRAGCAALSIAPEQRDTFDWKALAIYLRKELPRYAVPVFIRLSQGEVGGLATHTNKQDKVSLRSEGLDPALRGTKVTDGGDDLILWLKPGTGEERYVRFEGNDWDNLVGGTAKL